MIRRGIGLGQRRPTLIDSIDPATVAQVMAGGYWDTRLGFTALSGGSAGYSTWASQAIQTNTFITLVDGAFHPPTMITDASIDATGDPIWHFNGTAGGSAEGGLIVPATGTALRPADQWIWAGWFRLAVDDSNLYYMIEQWPGDAVWSPGGPQVQGHNRWFAYHNDTPGKMSCNGSPDGNGFDADLMASPPRPDPGRWKSNNLLIPFTGWHYFEWECDIAGGTNRLDLDAAKRSTKFNTYVDGILLPGDGFSAPQTPVPPDGPVFDDHVYTGQQRLCAGSNYAGTPWVGWIKNLYFMNGRPSAATRRKIMNWRKPRNP